MVWSWFVVMVMDDMGTGLLSSPGIVGAYLDLALH